jgi:hypothetical protein
MPHELLALTRKSMGCLDFSFATFAIDCDNRSERHGLSQHTRPINSFRSDLWETLLMRVTTRFFAALAAVAVLGYASVSSAVTMTTTPINPSTLTLDVTLDGGDGPVLVGTSGALSVNGSADIAPNIDADGAGGPWTAGPGNGNFAFTSSSFLIQDTSFLIDLGFGPGLEITATLVGVGLGITSSDIPVTGNLWDLDAPGGAPASLSMNLNQGQILLSGDILAALGADNPTVLDLNTDPVGVSLADILGFGINGTADNNSVNITIPTIAIDVGESAGLGAGALFVNLSGSINVLAVPEPSSIAMLGIGVIGLVAVGRRRFRKA